jgi:uncharacterized membrane protein
MILGFIIGNISTTPTDFEGAASFEDFVEIFSSFYASNALWLLIIIIAGFIGSLAILVILLDRSRPTVGQAISIALSLFLAYFILSIITALVTGIGFLFLIIPGIYFSVKFYLAPSIMVAERQTNPIDAMKSSWALTKGNSLRIFFYLLIIGVVLGVVSLLVQGISGLLGVTIGLVVSALFGGVIAVFNLAVAAGVYLELRGPMTEDLTETFG